MVPGVKMGERAIVKELCKVYMLLLCPTANKIAVAVDIISKNFRPNINDVNCHFRSADVFEDRFKTGHSEIR